MVGRLAGRLVISGGRITTGTTPKVMEEDVACGGMRGACEENKVDFTLYVGTCEEHEGNMRGTCGEHVGDRDANPDSAAAVHSPT